MGPFEWIISTFLTAALGAGGWFLRSTWKRLDLQDEKQVSLNKSINAEFSLVNASLSELKGMLQMNSIHFNQIQADVNHLEDEMKRITEFKSRNESAIEWVRARFESGEMQAMFKQKP